MTDKELLELAAKAAGIKYDIEHSKQKPGVKVWWGLWLHYDDEPGEYAPRYWNPLTSDGDALRLAVKLGIPVFPYDDETSTGTFGVVAKNFGSKEENTRRAIVRAAAELGKATQ